MKKVFFDTEFTGLKKDTTLISIGLITETGKTFYAELNDFDVKAYEDHWLLNNVLKHTVYLKDKEINKDNKEFNSTKSKTVYGNKEFVRKSLISFLEDIREGEDIQLVSDVCHYDMVLFIDLFGMAFDLPDFISPVCTDINALIAKFYNIEEYEAFDKNRENILKENNISNISSYNLAKHNSLWDALVIKAIYDLVK